LGVDSDVPDLYYFLICPNYIILRIMKKETKIPKSNETATIQPIGRDIVKVRMVDGKDPNVLVSELHGLILDTIKTGASYIVFDMSNVEYPNASFIAMLIGTTTELRRTGGDLKLIHVLDTARNNFTIFSPLTYLSIGADEVFSLKGLMDAHPSQVEDLVDFIPGRKSTLRVDASVDNLNSVNHFVSILAKKAGMEEMEISKLKIAVYEACLNVVEHGYNFEPGSTIGIEVLCDKGRFAVTISDKGEPFDFYGVKDYNVQEAFDQKKQGGFGLYIIKRSVDEIKYESNPKEGNRLTLVKKL
jgi:serine/threonine-protein kinase RsbW